MFDRILVIFGWGSSANRRHSTRSLAVAMVATVALIACTGEDQDGEIEDFLQETVTEYAVEMVDWWEIIYGPAGVAFLQSEDYERIYRHARERDPNNRLTCPEPSRPFPGSDDLWDLHHAIVSACRAAAAANAVVDIQGAIVGLAAGFCDPWSAPGVLRSFARRAAAIQNWRENGERCDDGARWGGRYRGDDDDASTWTAQCPGAYGEFRVQTFVFVEACEALSQAEDALEDLATVWALRVVALCGADPPEQRPGLLDVALLCQESR